MSPAADEIAYRRNRELFSNHYLDEHLPDAARWNNIDEDALETAWEAFQALWTAQRSSASSRNESQLEETFIRPAFRILGIPFAVDAPTVRTRRRPDYGFFPTATAAERAVTRGAEGEDFYEEAIAVADTTRWNRPLDTRGSGDHDGDFENPSYLIHVYLQETPVEWAVLTNGRKWRLYHASTSHRLDTYYEVDLPAILEADDRAVFRYFYCFFRRDAFLPDERGECFLDAVREESTDFAQELGADLQENIHEAITVLAEGFLEYPDNELGAADVGRIHDSALVYLYRLIFVLYAEAEGRELLDTTNPIYERSYSLHALKREVAATRDGEGPGYQPCQDTLWHRLENLFRLIDGGSAAHGIPEDELDVPAYNGGLFRTEPSDDDPDEARFLARHTVGDAALAEVIDLLTRMEHGGEVRFVDYASLDVRHLGSIYEELLEYQLALADEPLGLVQGTYVPAGGDDEVAIEAGEVYLATESGERRASGSYYTPEYIVEHIVERTLGPLVAEIRDRLHDQDTSGFAGDFAEAIFELRVLDPAMGSGHFLTNAVDYLGRAIVDAQAHQAAQDGIEAVDAAHDINWARRQVAQRCIYGVDLNPMAVELAKGSLWLRTLTAEEPLAVLDHQLKTGNALVGSDLAAIEALDPDRPAQAEHAPLVDAKEIESQDDVFERNRHRRRREAMADVHAAEPILGEELPDDAYERMAAAIDDDEAWNDITENAWFDAATAWAAEEGCFHWKLAFPEVFYDAAGEELDNPGFDAVIGNPPYFRLDTLSPSRGDVLAAQFPSVYQGGGDILSLFLARGIELTRTGGGLGFITARYVLESTSAEAVRRYVCSNAHVRELIDFGGMQPFESVSIQAIIPILTVGGEDGPTEVVRLTDDEASYDAIAAALADPDAPLFERYECLIDEQGGPGTWAIERPEVRQLLDRMRADTIRLEEIATVAQSMQSGRSSVFVVSPEDIEAHDLEAELLRPIVKSGDIRRYYVEENADRLLWTEGVDLSSYPHTRAYLEAHQNDLAGRYDIERREAPWWSLSNPRNCDLFESVVPRVLTPYMSPRNRFYLDREGYLNDGGDIRGIFPDEASPYHPAYFVAILNSTAGEFVHHRRAKRKDAGKYEYFGNVLNDAPIPTIDFDRRPIEIDWEAVIERHQRDAMTAADEAAIEALLANPHTASGHDMLVALVEELTDLLETRTSRNLSLPDHLGEYRPGARLDELAGYQQVRGVGETLLSDTTESRENLRIGRAAIERPGDRDLRISLSVRYKPADGLRDALDRWGYVESDLHPAIHLTGLDEPMVTLVEAFVDHVVNEAGEGDGFRAEATKTISPLDRLRGLRLPRLEDVRDEIGRYRDVREDTRRLDAQIEATDGLVDRLVFCLFDLEEADIQLIRDVHAFDRPEGRVE